LLIQPSYIDTEVRHENCHHHPRPLRIEPIAREAAAAARRENILFQHVYERACESNAAIAIVATDDRRIFDAVQSFGGHAVMTRDDHPSGTDRVAEVAEKLDADIIVNLQGD